MMGKIRVLDGKAVTLICQYFPPEGGAAANRMRFFTYWLRQHGADLAVVTAMPNYPVGKIQGNYKGKIWFQEIEQWGAVLRTWCYTSPKRSAVRRMLNYFSFMFLSLRWLPRVRKSDVVIFSSGPMFAGLVAFLSAKLFGTKVILDVRDLWPDRIWESGAIKLPKFVMKMFAEYERFMYRNTVSIMGVTNGVCDAIRKRTKGIPVYLIRNCDQEIGSLNSAGRRSGQKLGGSIVIIEAGTMGWVQDPEILCDAYGILRTKGIQNISLIFAGSGPRVDVIKGNVDHLEHANYLGNLSQDELWNTLSTADIGVATLKPLEHNKLAVPRRIYDYARAGLAIIIVGEGEGADILESSGAGIVVPPGDSQALASAIENLVKDEKLLEYWQGKSRLLLEGNLSPRVIGEQFIQIVSSCSGI